MIKKTGVFFSFLMFAGASVSLSSVPIHHDLTVVIDPSSHYIEAQDTITVPADQVTQGIHFLLHKELSVFSETENIAIQLEKDDLIGSYSQYSVRLQKERRGDLLLSIRYSGKIYNTVRQITSEYARGFSETPGIISQEGVYLAGSTFWVPLFNDGFITFTMTVFLPESWDAVSQGQRTIHTMDNHKRKVRWESPDPMDEVFLIAAEFHEYYRFVNGVDTMAFLRVPDDNLADKYLETTAQYLNMYQKLIGRFPYKKFALVENFWETGYGMPSFTLLGSRIIRFPFILHSSYPHELLHNWWGNSVFVDYDSGNWCEGLTVFLADHLIKEQHGQGAEYRSTTLQKYTDYVNKGNDFPLTAFRSRRDDPSEAVGYGKSMMMWNMLRIKLGDSMFVKGIQQFYKKNRSRRAAFDDIQKSFETVANRDLEQFFRQWVTRTGAPVLQLSDVKAETRKDGFNLLFTLSQTQPEEFYRLDVPLAVFLEGKEYVCLKNAAMIKKRQQYNLFFSSRPIRVDIDPQFDIFRRLHRSEIPPSFSQAFGSEKVLILLPSRADAGMLKAYQKLAESWSREKGGAIEITLDKDLSTIPVNRTVWLFGWENIHRKKIAEAISLYGAGVGTEFVRFSKTTLTKQGNSFVIAARNPGNINEIAVWLASDRSGALPGLGRKLPHYGKYSYLAFEGDEPTNIRKGRWPAVNSPMSSIVLQPDGSQPDIFEGKLPARHALADLPPVSYERH